MSLSFPERRRTWERVIRARIRQRSFAPAYTRRIRRLPGMRLWP